LQQGSVRFAFVSRNKIQEKGGAGLKATTVPFKSTSSSTWSRIAWYVKVIRIPFLLAAVYSLGYQQGVMDTVRNPLKLQQGTFEKICGEMGVSSGEDIDIISERQKNPNLFRIGWVHGVEDDAGEKERNPLAQKVADIGREIIRAARQHIRDELHQAVTKAKENLKEKELSLSKLEYARLLNEDEEVKFWVEAMERIEGYSVDGIQNWQYVLIATPIPNAFVTEMLPQRFFVTTGLFEKFVENDDELAMVLGHEISHLIMGHLSHGNVLEFMFRGLEIAVLMLDPTNGMISLGIATFLASSRDALVAANSRSNETEADELGCKLAAMACYDTVRGCKVFLKMHEEDKAHGTANHDLMASHPASLDRYEFLKKLSSEENVEKYSYCDRLRKHMRRALTLVGDKPL
jgi:Zn-dependent protease with chaperone function